MTRQHLLFFIQIGIWKISQIPRNLGSWEISQILETPQMPGYLRNSQSFEKFGEFPKNLGIREISRIPSHLRNSKYRSQIYIYVFGKFLRYPGIWEIHQIPGFFGNSHI